jgi:hypothetical protein
VPADDRTRSLAADAGRPCLSANDRTARRTPEADNPAAGTVLARRNTAAANRPSDRSDDDESDSSPSVSVAVEASGGSDAVREWSASELSTVGVPPRSSDGSDSARATVVCGPSRAVGRGSVRRESTRVGIPPAEFAELSERTAVLALGCPGVVDRSATPE